MLASSRKPCGSGNVRGRIWNPPLRTGAVLRATGMAATTRAFVGRGALTPPHPAVAQTYNKDVTLTSALLVDGKEHGGGTFVTFTAENYQEEQAAIRFAQPTRAGGGRIPAGSYAGVMNFTVEYSEPGASEPAA